MATRSAAASVSCRDGRRYRQVEERAWEAREAIRDALDETSGAAALDDERLPYEEIQVTRGWRAEWKNLPAVKAAMEGK